MAPNPSIDDLVHSVTLYIGRPLILHGYILPFLFFYLALAWTYFAASPNDYYEASLIAFAGLVCLQILTYLFCHWSVHIRCFLTCKKVGFEFKETINLIILVFLFKIFCENDY